MAVQQIGNAFTSHLTNSRKLLKNGHFGNIEFNRYSEPLFRGKDMQKMYVGGKDAFYK